MKLKAIFLLICLVLLAGVLRFYKLGEIPNGLYQDETAIGWNAYSILKTGKDEYGTSYPIYFKSFGDYKLPTYIYSTIFPIWLFGLTPFAVRFPSAFFGTLVIPVFFFLVRKLTKNEQLALLSTFLLTINPWHVHYSRATFEVSIVLFLFTIGTLLFIHALEKKTGAFLGSVLAFILAIYTYNVTRLLSPLILLGLILLYRKNFKNINMTEKIGTLMFGLLMLLPFIATYLQKGGISSASGTLIFSSAAVHAPLLEFRSYFVHLPLVNKIVLNSLTLVFWQYLTNVINYFSIPFFFVMGSSHGNHGIGTDGLFFLFELPFIILGFYAFIKERQENIRALLLIAITTILVASLTRESPHATRSYSLLMFIPVISAGGILHFLHFLRKKSFHIQAIFSIAFLVLFTFSVAHYFLSYYVRFPIAYAKQWREEDKNVTQYIRNNWNTYDHIIIDSDAGFIYSSILFYLPFSPQEFQETNSRLPDDDEGMSDVRSFGKITYKKVDVIADSQIPNTLLITGPEKVPNSIRISKTFKYPTRPIVIALKQKIIQYPIQEVAYVAISSENQ